MRVMNELSASAALSGAPSPITTRHKTPALFWLVMGGSIVLASIPTLWKDLDLTVAALFASGSEWHVMKQWWWVAFINDYVPMLFRIALGIAALAWVWVKRSAFNKVVTINRWRTPLALFVIAGVMGPGLVVNAVFKDNWQRSRPYEVQNFGGTQQFTRAGLITDQCNNNCAFVSGHVACGFFLISMMLVDRRRKVAWASVGLVAGGVIGLARVADMAHWLSDVLWACPITLITSWLVWQCLMWLDRSRPRPGYLASPAP